MASCLTTALTTKPFETALPRNLGPPAQPFTTMLLSCHVPMVSASVPMVSKSLCHHSFTPVFAILPLLFQESQPPLTMLSASQASGQRPQQNHKRKVWRGAGRKNFDPSNKGLCKWYGAGFCKHASKCAKRKDQCVDGQKILDVEEAWLLAGKRAGIETAIEKTGAAAGGTVSGAQNSRDKCDQVENKEISSAGQGGDKEMGPGARRWLLVMDLEGGANDRPGEVRLSTQSSFCERKDDAACNSRLRQEPVWSVATSSVHNLPVFAILVPSCSGNL
eukprot:3932616-Rhodomonas_salina.1